jgi:hypothetical protein
LAGRKPFRDGLRGRSMAGYARVSVAIDGERTESGSVG